MKRGEKSWISWKESEEALCDTGYDMEECAENWDDCDIWSSFAYALYSFSKMSYLILIIGYVN